MQACLSESESGSETEEMEVEAISTGPTCSPARPGQQRQHFLPAETLDSKESVELWKSRNETDVIGGPSFAAVLYCTVLFSIRPRRVRH